MFEQKTMSVQEQLLELVKSGHSNENTFINSDLRQKAINEFVALGIPTIKNEEWKFTNVSPLFKGEFHIDNFTKASVLDTLSINDKLSIHLNQIQAQIKGETKGAYRLVLMNGNIVHELSYLPDNSHSKICYLSELSQSEIDALKIGKIANVDGNHFSALNTALINDGLFIKILKNQVIDKPIHIIHILDSNKSTLFNQRAYIHLEANANVELVETYLNSDGENHTIANNVIYEIQLDNQSTLDHYDIQKSKSNLHQIKRTEVAQDLHSNYSNYTFNLPGGKLFRNNLSIYINAKDTNCHLYGLYLTDKNQLVDNHTEVHHKFPNCESNQLYKGVLLDESKAVFNGKIFVYEDAQKTNAFQKSNNLLLSDKATIHAKPQLEIFADDVKCSHGSTIGQLDDKSMFYLNSRGIGKASAKRMLVNAFAFDVAEKVKNPTLRQYLEEEIIQAIN